MSTPSSSSPVLVFGAAGGIGRHAAVSASSKGAKVWLAMRDTNKPIPGLTAAAERAANFTRIQADLTSPASLTAALQASGAKTAFVYAVFASADGLKAAFDALKQGGVEFVVFLSAYAVQPSAEAALSLDVLPRMHARIELNLRESGIRYVALRPAYFDTNLLFHRGYAAGKVRAFGVDSVNDFIAPEDIGAAAGTLLTSPPEEKFEDDAIYMCGPKLMAVRDAIQIVGEVLGKEIEVEGVSEEEHVKESGHMPKEMVESMLELNRKCTPPNTIYPEGFWKEAVGNLKRWKGGELMGLKEWVEKHKDEFVN